MDVRTSAIVSKLVYHIHNTVKEFQVTEDELMKAIDFLTKVGKNGEYHLLSDVLNVSVLVDKITYGSNRNYKATDHNVEGPLYREEAPLCTYEATLYDKEIEEGDILVVTGKVRSASGHTPIPNALVDVWQSNHHGDYENEDPKQPDYNLRRRIQTNENGEFQFKTVIPGPYRIGKGGHVGKLLEAMGRHDWRPAHIHFKVEGEGHEKLTTMLFIKNDPWIHSDAIGAVKESLILKMQACNDQESMEKYGVQKPFFTAHYDFVLQEQVK